MSQLPFRLAAWVRAHRQRRLLTNRLEALSDHLLRDVGIERHLIDDAVATEFSDKLGVARLRRPPVFASAVTTPPSLEGCG